MQLLQNNKKEFVLGRHHTNLHYTFGRSFFTNLTEQKGKSIM